MKETKDDDKEKMCTGAASYGIVWFIPFKSVNHSFPPKSWHKFKS